MVAHLEEAEKQILGALLADFSARELSASTLKRLYEGPKVSDLSNAICVSDEITSVDFQLALKDLESKKLIRTGPYRSYENKPGSAFIFLGGRSLREYAALTEEGYKTAKKQPKRPASSQRTVNNVHISGGHFNNMQLAAGDAISQKMELNMGADTDILLKLVTILEEQGKTVTKEQQDDLSTAIEQAKDGNGKLAKSLLERVCGPSWEALQPVMWPILGELVKQSLGI